jgi:hypothetical protein
MTIGQAAQIAKLIANGNDKVAVIVRVKGTSQFDAFSSDVFSQLRVSFPDRYKAVEAVMPEGW